MTYSCLIIEDSNFIREIYHFVLRESPYRIVDFAVDGEEALFKIKSLQPDVIILDLVIPLMNGFDVLSRTHELSPNSRVIVVSSLDDPRMKQKAKALGAISYLEKPFKKENLLQALTTATLLEPGVKNG